MGKEDWVSIRLPYLLVQAIDRFIDTDTAKKNGIFSRNDFVTRVVASWFANYEKEYGIFVPRAYTRAPNGEDITKPFD